METTQRPPQENIGCPHNRTRDRGPVGRLVPGLGLSVLLALVATKLVTITRLESHGINALTAAIALGMLVGNILSAPITSWIDAGATLSKQTLLRAGVVLYGLRLTLHDVGHVGIAGVLIDALVVISTFATAVTLGTRLFHLDRQTSILIGVGSAICGAAAVLAAEPVVRAKADHVAMAISTVVVFGTVAIFIYPALYPLVPHGATVEAARQFGVYAGSTIHEVAQVFAAGRSVSQSVADTAVVTKMVRVMMLAPFLIGLSAWLANRPTEGVDSNSVRVATIPWFAIAFVGVVAFNSFGLLSACVLGMATTVDTLLLATAMAALGLTTRIQLLRDAGPKPLWLGATLFAWLIIGGGAINALVQAWLS